MLQKQVAGIGYVKLILTSPDAVVDFTGRLIIQLLDPTGVEKAVQDYDVMPQLTANQKTAIGNLLTAFRTKAQAETL